MKSRSIWLFLLLLEVFISVACGWMESNWNRQFYSDSGRLTQEESRRAEVSRKVLYGQDGIHASCEKKYCERGSQCIVNKETNQPECRCIDDCKPSYMPVCGSDGKFYENHCELHRASCLQKKKIYIIHNKDCFFKEFEILHVMTSFGSESYTWDDLHFSFEKVLKFASEMTL